jgi:exosortase E/protease (VPEID-CTERM system)
MIPTGIAVIWMLNAVRITALIVIGQWSSAIAVTGFHSVAGWIFFNLTAFGLVSMSHRASWLIRDDALSDSARNTANPATPYLAPLLATIGVAMLTAPFSSGFEAAYPLQVLITGLALWWYRDRIGATLINFSWTGVTIGALCFGIWVLLARPDHVSNLAFGAHLKSLPSWMLGGWVIARIAGAVITVPLAEELAFRGYLQRKLIAPDFTAVPFDQFTWASFAITSTAFGLLHQSWIAGICAGMLFAFAVYRRGRLADAILAHAVANALLAAYILTTGNWSLWL